MNYCGLNTCDTSNGDGVRVSLFVSGCSLHCKGCFNPEAWDKNYGQEFTDETLKTLLDALRSPYVKGLSVLGGDPLEDYNVATVTSICRAVKKKFPEKTIWVYTGRKFDNVKHLELFKYVDILVDGAFIESKKVVGKYYGSSNQRLITLRYAGVR